MAKTMSSTRSGTAYFYEIPSQGCPQWRHEERLSDVDKKFPRMKRARRERSHGSIQRNGTRVDKCHISIHLRTLLMVYYSCFPFRTCLGVGYFVPHLLICSP
uniref:Uncharacterized protein n=1 Tax=Trypanosoma congolense (strain IL3000) TaxID=1068625 RepID=G0USC1_TRYCI|nr:hypothetical protein, unlikely [Trypanosoma congolense IL3000]